MDNKWALYIFIGIAMIIPVTLFIMELNALYHCGWSGLIYGRNVFWAYYFGYCEG